jgi:hypothetical protein
MLQTASTKIQTPNLITTAIGSNHFNHSHHSLSLSFLLNYTLDIGKSQILSLENSQIFPKSLYSKGLRREEFFCLPNGHLVL